MYKCISGQGQWSEIWWVSVYLTSWNRTLLRSEEETVKGTFWYLSPMPRRHWRYCDQKTCQQQKSPNINSKEDSSCPSFSLSGPLSPCCSQYSHLRYHFQYSYLLVSIFLPTSLWELDRGNALIVCVSGTWPSTRHLIDAQSVIL